LLYLQLVKIFVWNLPDILTPRIIVERETALRGPRNN